VKKCNLLIATALLATSVAAATDMPSAEVYLGYSLVHFSPNSSIVPSFNANGGVAQFGYNFNEWLSGVVDFNGMAKSGLVATNLDNRMFTLTVGPRVTFNKHNRFQPYGQVLFGAARASSRTDVTVLPGGIIWPPPSLPGLSVPSQPLTAQLEASRTGFAMLAGVGLDIKIGKHFAFRPVEASYFLSRFTSILSQNDTNRNHFRYSAGVNFLFGTR
jgi:hypothetical protein